MITTAQYIAITFRLINFGVVIGLIVYVFKTRALPFIYKKIKDRIEAASALKLQEELLVFKHQELLKQVAVDEQTARLLKERIDRWAAAVAKEQQARTSAKEQQQIYVQRQAERRAYERARVQAYDAVTRAAIAEVKEKFIETLAQEKKSKEYFAHLINSLAMRGQ